MDSLAELLKILSRALIIQMEIVNGGFEHQSNINMSRRNLKKKKPSIKVRHEMNSH